MWLVTIRKAGTTRPLARNSDKRIALVSRRVRILAGPFAFDQPEIVLTCGGVQIFESAKVPDASDRIGLAGAHTAVWNDR